MSAQAILITKLSLIYFLGIAAPGPNLAIIIKNSLSCSRYASIITFLGVLAGTTIQIIALLVAWSHLSLEGSFGLAILKLLGGLYLIYIGYNSLMVKKKKPDYLVKGVTSKEPYIKMFTSGLFTSIINPMLTVFLISIFSAFVKPGNPFYINILYLCVLIGITAIWFGSIGFFLSNKKVQGYLLSYSHWIERTTGLFLTFLGFKLLMVA